MKQRRDIINVKRELNNIFIYLKEDKYITVELLAEKLKVSKITIYRYIHMLQDQDEQIIITKEGRYGGVRLVKGYNIPKKKITVKQMNMVISGLQLLKNIDDDPEILVLIDMLPTIIK